MSHCTMCELANVKTFPELKLQFAFLGASVLHLISIVGTEKKTHTKLLIFHVDFIHIFEIPSNWPKVFGTHLQPVCSRKIQNKLWLKYYG